MNGQSLSTSTASTTLLLPRSSVVKVDLEPYLITLLRPGASGSKGLFYKPLEEQVVLTNPEIITVLAKPSWHASLVDTEEEFFMRFRNLAGFAAALLIGALSGSLIGPRPAEAVAREIIELQRDVTTLLQGQKDIATQVTQDHTVMRTLIEQSNDTVGKLNGTMSGLQKSVQDVQANSGARLDTMSTQVQGLSDNLEEIKSRLGKLNQQLVDLQNTVQSVDAKISGGGGTAPATGVSNPGASISQPTSSMSPAGGASGGPAPSADTLYSNGLRDI